MRQLDADRVERPDELPSSVRETDLAMTASTQKMESQVPPLRRGDIFAMAACAGSAVANLYYNQPLLGLIKANYAGSTMIGMIPTATQLGYAGGLLFLVPLGDLVERRRLIVGQFVALAVTLALVASATTTFALVASSLVLGFSASVAQQIVPFALTLADARARGAVVGTIVSGILGGILLSRTIAGFVGAHFGWREMFWLGVPLALLAAVTLRSTLPISHPAERIRYASALRSLVDLLVDERELRVASVTQASLFASFTAFWTVLSLHLQEPRFELGAQAAGLFGIIGASGILAAPLAGRAADKNGPHQIVILGCAITLLSWPIFGVWHSLAGLTVGVVLLDVGVNCAIVSNQHLIFTLRPQARSRTNTVFMTAMYLGGAIGSLGATWAYTAYGWTGVCAYGGSLALGALLLQLSFRSRRRHRSK